MRRANPLQIWYDLQRELEYGRARLWIYLDETALSQAEFARAAHISTSAVSAFLGRRANPSLPVLLSISRAMNLALWQLLAPLDRG